MFQPMAYPHNYALWIMHYELIITRTSVRLYEREDSPTDGLSPQLRITHYALRIMNYEFGTYRGMIWMRNYQWEMQNKTTIGFSYNH